MSDLPVFTRTELEAICGGYKRPADQLRELHRQGFFRAWISKRTRQVVLERAHFDAVRAGAVASRPVPFTLPPMRRRTTARKPMRWDAPTALYRHFDKAGALLYIGIAVDPAKREAEHRRESEWAARIHRIEVEWHESRRAARDAERAAIATERPPFNILHAGRR